MMKIVDKIIINNNEIVELNMKYYKHHELKGSELIVENGQELLLDNKIVKLHGDLVIMPGGKLNVNNIKFIPANGMEVGIYIFGDMPNISDDHGHDEDHGDHEDDDKNHSYLYNGENIQYRIGGQNIMDKCLLNDLNSLTLIGLGNENTFKNIVKNDGIVVSGGSEVTINGFLVTEPIDFIGGDDEYTKANNVKEFYYKSEDFKAVTTAGDNVWQEFQYMGIDEGYTGHESSGGSVGDDVKNAHGNVLHGPFVVPIYSDNECLDEMGYLYFVESARVEDPNSSFYGQKLSTMAKLHVKLNDENTLSYGITSNELLNGYYELDTDVIVKITGNTKTGPFDKYSKVLSNAIDYKSLRIRKISDTTRKGVLSIEEDPVSFHSNLPILWSPVNSVEQSMETKHTKFYYNSADFKAVSTDETKTIYQDYQYISLDKDYTGHSGEVGDYVKNGRGNISHAVWSVKICSDSAGLYSMGEITWVITALIDDPELAIGSQENGLLTKEEIWLKLDGEEEDSICLGYTVNRTDTGYYKEDKDVLVKIIKNGHVGPFDENGNFSNFSNFKSMRIRNIGEGVRECVASTDENPPTFEEDKAAVAVSLEQSPADDLDVEFYYSSDDFGTDFKVSTDETKTMYQDYQYVSVDKDYTGHNAVGENVQNARGNVLYAAWSVPIYADSALTTILGGFSWVITANVPDTSLPFTEQDLTTCEQIFVHLNGQDSMSIGQCSNVLEGGYYELDKDVLIDIVDTVNQGPLDVNASHTTAPPGFQTCRVRKIDSKLRKGVISKSSIHPALDTYNSNANIQSAVDELNLLLIELYPNFMEEHDLILVADAESVRNDLLQIPDVGQEIVDQVFADNNAAFLHLTEDTENKGWNTEKYNDIITRAANGGNKAIRVLELIQYLNPFTKDIDARDDSGLIQFNYSNEAEGIFNGINEDIGIHHLGFFKSNQLMDLLKNQGYGTMTWYGLSVYGSDKLSIWGKVPYYLIYKIDKSLFVLKDIINNDTIFRKKSNNPKEILQKVKNNIEDDTYKNNEDDIYTWILYQINR